MSSSSSRRRRTHASYETFHHHRPTYCHFRILREETRDCPTDWSSRLFEGHHVTISTTGLPARFRLTTTISLFSHPFNHCAIGRDYTWVHSQMNIIEAYPAQSSLNPLTLSITYACRFILVCLRWDIDETAVIRSSMNWPGTLFESRCLIRYSE